LPPGDMNPPFFDWHVKLPANPPRYCLRNIPVIVACLARDSEIGLREKGGHVHVSYKNTPVDNPRGLLRTLSKAREAELLGRLEGRFSTNSAKNKGTRDAAATGYGLLARSPIDGVSWGMSGRENRCRWMWYSIVMSPGSTWSDKEIRILLALHLNLWSTAMRAAVYSRGVDEATCYCGAKGQTAAHLLNLPPGDDAHSEWLRSVRNIRHSELTAEVADAVDETWTAVAVEHLDNDMTGAVPVALRDAIAEAAVLKQLHMDGDTGEHQHCKPDGIVWNPASRTVYIYDVTTASDHLLWEEERFWTHLKALGMTEWKAAVHPGMFDDDGVIQEIGIAMVAPEHQGDVRRITAFTRIRYLKRYAKLAKVIRDTLRARHVYRPTVRILTFAVGTGGYIPLATESALKTLVPDKAPNKKLCRTLMTLCLRLAVKVYGAWRAEQEAHHAAQAMALG
jgi:hypothetical protein